MGCAAMILVLASTAVDARFLVTVAGVPSASLQVSLREDAYRYQALHVLEEGEARFERAWTLADGGVEGLEPEVLALLGPPRPGCRTVREERSGRAEALCVAPHRGARVEGTLDGVPFRARYAAGRLEGVEVGPVRFQRVRGAPVLAFGLPNPFVEGFVVSGRGSGPALAPPLPGVRAVGVGPGEGSGSRRRCLAAARDAVAADARRKLVLGLVVVGDRAFPHAWVRSPAGDVDPTLGPGEASALAERTYLELPSAAAGAVYLELLDGRRRVVRLRAR
jgi:hypothetical protein